MVINPTAYTRGIDKRVIALIMSAKSSIVIAMAWFTDNEIKDALIKAKRKTNDLSIRIVVDDNKINDKYFYDYRENFEKLDIRIDSLVKKKFLHHKFMVIDKNTTLIGSYNFTKKAKNNLESIVVTQSEELSDHFIRIFRFLTEESYIDENIKLLFDNIPFAQAIISTYHDFSKAQYKTYKEKIDLGECYTYDNGLCDIIWYKPGFIFNRKIFLENPQPRSEFSLPINKDVIRRWTEQRNLNNLLSQYREIGIPIEKLGMDLDKLENDIETEFSKKFSRTYNKNELKILVSNQIDIIIEDDLWENNFAPFLNNILINELLESFANVEKQNNEI